MSHLRPLTVTWFSVGVRVGDNFEGSQPPPRPVPQRCCQPAWTAFSEASQNRRALGAPVSLQAGLLGPALHSVTSLLLFGRACGLTFPSLAS